MIASDSTSSLVIADFAYYSMCYKKLVHNNNNNNIKIYKKKTNTIFIYNEYQ